MQTTAAPRNTNPLLQEASTTGVPFWQILASTTGGLLTPALSPTAASLVKPQDPGESRSGQGTGPATSDSSPTDGATSKPNTKAIAAIPSSVGKIATDTAELAEKIVSSVTGQKPVRRDPSQVNASSQTSPASATGDGIAAMISVPAQVSAPIANPGDTQAAAKTPSVTSATDSQTTPAPDGVALPAPARAAAPTVAQVLQSTGREAANLADGLAATPAALAPLTAPAIRAIRNDAVNAAIPGIAAANGANAALSGSIASASHNAAPPQPAGDSAPAPSQSPAGHTNATIPANLAANAMTAQNPATGSNAGGTAAPTPQPGGNQATPPSAVTTVAVALAATGQALHLPTAADNSGPAAQVAQSTASASVAAHGAAATSSPAANAKGNDASSASDKSSHQQPGGGGTAASGATANLANNPPAQHAADPGQTTAAKTPDSTPPIVQTMGHPAAPAQIIGGHSAEAAASTDAARASSSLPADVNEAAATGGINTARLIQTLGETGMQVGMRSAEFGDISIRTTLSQQQMTTQIAVDHGDLSRAIAAHVPAMQAKLGDDLGIRASIQVNQTGTSFAGGQSDASAGQQRTYSSAVQPMSLSAIAEPEPVGSVAVAGDDDRLDIQA